MKIKRTLLLILLISITVIAVACTTNNSPNKSSEAKSTFTVIDQAGREVQIPEDARTIAYVYGVATNYIIALGHAEDIVANNAKIKFYSTVAPHLEEIGTVGTGMVDYEALAEVKPDIFIHRANDPETLDHVTAMGIPTIAIKPESTEDILETIRLLGKVLHEEDRAAEIIDYYRDKVEFATNLVSDIPEDERYTAIVMGHEIGMVANGQMLQSFLIETAGGINSAKNVAGTQTWPVVGTESIFEWNPDFIFCTNSVSSMYTVDEIMKDPTWAGMNAVKNNKVILVPSMKESWEFPGIASMLGFLWMLNQMYPELYSEEELIAEIDHFYQFIYGMSFEREFLGY